MKHLSFLIALTVATLSFSAYFAPLDMSQDARQRMQQQCDQLSHQQRWYSAGEMSAKECSGWSVRDFARAMEYAVYEAIREGKSADDVERDYLSRYAYYSIATFRQHIKTFSGYRSHIKSLQNRMMAQKQESWFSKVLGFLQTENLPKRELVQELYEEIIKEEKEEQQVAKQQQKQRKLQARQELQSKQKSVRATFEQQGEILNQLSDEWIEIQDIYQECGLPNSERYERRKQALHGMASDGCVYETKAYPLSSTSKKFIADIGADIAGYKSCYGNQLQQVIHQECIDGIDRLAMLPQKSVVYPYKDPLAHCFDAACEYNQAGAIDKATAVTDFCWLLLDYGKAIAEGAALGVVGAAQDFLEHPGQAVLCAMAGEYVLAYQLSKVLYNALDISITYAFDADQGKKKWDECIAPVTHLIDAISNKELSLRDGLKGATQFAVQWKAQDKLLKGMNKFCKTAKTRAMEFAKNNPYTSPAQYMVTPEGMMFKSSYNGTADNKNMPNGGPSGIKEKLEWTSHRFKHVPPKHLSWKEVIKATTNSDALYKPGINIKELELHAWQNGTPTTRGKNWRVFKAQEVIGANEGKETVFMRIECSANTIHGHPILESEYWEYLK